MKTASQILEAKGYDNVEQNDIVQANNNSLDLQVREFFGVDEPIHLYESYYIGDADEDVMNQLATSKGYEGYEGLLMDMDEKLNELAEEYPVNGVECLVIDDIDEFVKEYESVTGEDGCDLFDDNGGETDGNAYIIPVFQLSTSSKLYDWP